MLAVDKIVKSRLGECNSQPVTIYITMSVMMYVTVLVMIYVLV